MYKLNYQQHNILKQAAFIIMQNHNNKEYNSQKQNKQFIKYNQTLKLLYKKPQQELLDIIDKYLEQQEIQNNQQQQELYDKQIIITQLKQPTPEQLNHMIVKLQELEKQYYLQLDIDYTDEQSIKLAYQQILYYNYYKIPIPKKETEEILIGNLELLDKGERI